MVQQVLDLTMNPVPLRSRHHIRQTERQGERVGIKKSRVSERKGKKEGEEER